jgi:hypothetical protein
MPTPLERDRAMADRWLWRISDGSPVWQLVFAVVIQLAASWIAPVVRRHFRHMALWNAVGDR